MNEHTQKHFKKVTPKPAKIKKIDGEFFIKNLGQLAINNDINWNFCKSVESIEADTFNIAKHLKALAQPQGGKPQGPKQVELIKKLEKIQANLRIRSDDLPSQLTKIGNSAFQGVVFVKSTLNLAHTKIQTINANAFSNCKLKKLILPRTNKLIIDRNAFSNNQIAELDIREIENCTIKESAFLNNPLAANKVYKRPNQSVDFLNTTSVSDAKGATIVRSTSNKEQLKNKKLQEELKRIKNENRELQASATKNEANFTRSITKYVDEIKRLEKKLEVAQNKLRREKNQIRDDQKEAITKLRKDKSSLEKNQQHLKRNLEELRIKVKDYESNQQVALAKVGFILDDGNEQNDLTSLVPNVILNEFMKLILDFENLLLPLFVDFERILSANFFESSNEENNSLRTVCDRIANAEYDTIDFLNNGTTIKLQNTLARINLFRSENPPDWEPKGLKKLGIIVDDLKNIRNRLVHSRDFTVEKVVQDISQNGVKVIKVYHHKSRSVFYKRMELEGLYKVRAPEKSCYVSEYPMALCLLAFFIPQYQIVNVFRKMEFLLDDFAALGDQTIISKAKVTKIMGFDQKQIVQDFLSNFVK